MSDKTVCVSIGELTRAQGWSVHRVRTSSSTYHVAIAPSQLHRFAVLRGYSVGAGRLIDVRDSDPLIGGEPLFDVPPAAWSGKPLAFGTTVTSAVVEAATETDATIVTIVTSALMPVSQPARAFEHERPPYPEDWIERAEIAAECLRHLLRRRGLLDDIQRRPELLARLNVALGECALVVRAIAGRIAHS